MATETVTLTLDAQQYYREIAKVTQSGRGIERIGDDLGGGFLRGERAVGRATARMVQGLAQARSASDVLQISLLSMERVGRFGLPIAVAIAAGVSAFEVFNAEIKKTKEVSDALLKELGKPLVFQLQLSPSDIASEIEKITAAIEKARKQQQDPLHRFIMGFRFGTPKDDPTALSTQIEHSLERRTILSQGLADAELKHSNILKIELEQGKEAAKDAQIQLDFEEKRAKLFAPGAFKPGTQQIDLFKRLAAITQERDLSTELLAKERERVQAAKDLVAQHKADVDLLKQQEDKMNVFQRFIGGGASAIIAQQQLAAFQSAQLASAQRDFAARIARGAFGQSPLENAIFGKTPFAQDFSGVASLSGLDFTNLATLSELDFSGVASLSGLSITIK